MTTAHPTAAQIQATIDRIVTETRDMIGVTGPYVAHVYPGSDGKWVTAALTEYEAGLVDKAFDGLFVVERRVHIDAEGNET